MTTLFGGRTHRGDGPIDAFFQIRGGSSAQTSLEVDERLLIDGVDLLVLLRRHVGDNVRITLKTHA